MKEFHRSRSGMIAENEFINQCLFRELSVYKPIIDLDGVDFVVRTKRGYRRIQVKSASVKETGREYFKVSSNYPADSFELFCVYIHPEKSWYIIPERKITGKCVRVGTVGGKYFKYREAWNLLDG
ncbi:MAG: hypothetical protein ACI9IA_000215 [Enterobacterales bacterium]|jgi:hypothetical protein